jgi:hypothetical protein
MQSTWQTWMPSPAKQTGHQATCRLCNISLGRFLLLSNILVPATSKGSVTSYVRLGPGMEANTYHAHGCECVGHYILEGPNEEAGRHDSQNASCRQGQPETDEHECTLTVVVMCIPTNRFASIASPATVKDAVIHHSSAIQLGGYMSRLWDFGWPLVPASGMRASFCPRSIINRSAFVSHTVMEIEALRAARYAMQCSMSCFRHMSASHLLCTTVVVISQSHCHVV